MTLRDLLVMAIDQAAADELALGDEPRRCAKAKSRRYDLHEFSHKFRQFIERIDDWDTEWASDRTR